MTGALAETAPGDRPEPTNEQRAAKLVFLSIKHSQGSPLLEDEFINQAILCHPEWNAGNIDFEQAEQNFLDLVINYFDKGHHAPVDHFKIDTPRQADSAFSHLQNGISWGSNRSYPFRGELQRIAPLIIGRDEEYLIIRGGRPRNHAGERMRSFFCHHGLLSRPTGAWELDGLYWGVRNYALEEMENEPSAGWVRTARAVIRAHAAADARNSDQLLNLIPYEAQGRNLFDVRRELIEQD